MTPDEISELEDLSVADVRRLLRIARAAAELRESMESITTGESKACSSTYGPGCDGQCAITAGAALAAYDAAIKAEG